MFKYSVLFFLGRFPTKIWYIFCIPPCFLHVPSGPLSLLQKYLIYSRMCGRYLKITVSCILLLISQPYWRREHVTRNDSYNKILQFGTSCIAKSEQPAVTVGPDIDSTCSDIHSLSQLHSTLWQLHGKYYRCFCNLNCFCMWYESQFDIWISNKPGYPTWCSLMSFTHSCVVQCNMHNHS